MEEGGEGTEETNEGECGEEEVPEGKNWVAVELRIVGGGGGGGGGGGLSTRGG